jgi:hypothetical protein
MYNLVIRHVSHSIHINTIILYCIIVPRSDNYNLIVYEKFKEDKNKIVVLGYVFVLSCIVTLIYMLIYDNIW